MFLNEYDDIPFDALLYLTGECNYGGRVTDDKDRRLLNSLLSIYYNQNVLKVEGYSFSPSGVYHVPEETNYAGIIEYVNTLPLSPFPEVFGLHENADITKDNKETQNLLDSVLLTQTQITAGAGGEDMETIITELSDDILDKLPYPFDVFEVEKKYPTEYTQSMNTVLRQELIRYNGLTKTIRRSLIDVVKAVKGLVVMSKDLEEVFTSMLVGRVPNMWMSVGKSYPSLKPLGSYILDLLQRLKVFQDWIDGGIPNVFWLSGFYFTQSFLTGVLQNCARQQKISIDQLGFQFEVMKFESTKKIPSFGVYCKGLFMEGARWNRETMLLAESFPKILFDTIPIIWFKPGVKKTFKPQSIYQSPLYKTTARRGVLSTTGHSTNFVMYVEFKSDKEQRHWINRGVAALCQLDD
ncbi:dynein axonemal heavy chain 3 [Halyomorpha halys]|uniref:dynein axonemal heavy chain 3 n=1 Tax=Halyomorpha halys TaxID=286706 RepID=UPI000D0C852B|nr:dynein heavy chain 3, axonemal-like [Halyomorpha halys]